MNRMLAGFVFAAAALFGVTCVSAQCPTIKVYGPSSDHKIGEQVQFSVTVSDGDANVTPTFTWAVSDGTIAKGKNDVVVYVDSEGMKGNTITATVTVGGFAKNCFTDASWTAGFIRPPAARKVDEFGKLKTADENARLDNFATELQKDPLSEANIIVYHKKGGAKESAAALKRIEDYLQNTRGIDHLRIIVTEGGERKEFTVQLFLVPEGGLPPAPTPDKP